MRKFLERYVPLADMLVQTFGGDVEVVLHDLNAPEHSVVYVANGQVTGRTVGESFDQLIKQVILSERLQNDYVANYYFEAKNGKQIRSSTFLLRDNKNQLQGALCINVDTTRVQQQLAYLESLLPGFKAAGTEQAAEVSDQNNSQAADTSEHVVDMVTSLIENILKGCAPSLLSREEKIEKIRFMDAKGIFLMKGSVELVAEKLGVNKVTVYSYLDEARGKR